jgi:hypothetical protein
MLRRLRADWITVARGRGNPYKIDYRRGEATTALGDLVLTYRRERNGLRSPEVFDGLDRDVLRLARELPGAHPFLRKYVRRLARRLG